MSTTESDNERLFEEISPILDKYQNNTVYTVCLAILGHLADKEPTDQQKIRLIDATNRLLTKLANVGDEHDKTRNGNDIPAKD